MNSWQESKKKELAQRLNNLGLKLTLLTREAAHWKRWKAYFGKSGLRRHHRKMTEMSMNATRKKIYNLKKELQQLS